ncbi:MAG: cytochrome c [Ferruginibacter sp.]
MKKILSAVVLIILVWGCAKKMTPANTGTASSTTQNKPAETNAGGGTGEVAILIPTEPKVAPKQPSAEEAAIAAGQSTYTAKCGRCHNLKVTTNYTAERWTAILAEMAPRARLTDTEKENVYAYVKANSKK